MQQRRSGAAEGTADSTASGAASAQRRRQSSFQLGVGAVHKLLWPNALADLDRVFNSVRAVSWRTRPVRSTASTAASDAMKCSFVLWSREGWHLCISLEPDEIRVRFSHSHCFGRDGRPTSPKMQFGKHRLRGASVLHRYAAPRSLPCFIPAVLGHHSSRGSRPDTETLQMQPLLADGARRSLAAAPLPRHLHHPPSTADTR